MDVWPRPGRAPVELPTSDEGNLAWAFWHLTYLVTGRGRRDLKIRERLRLYTGRWVKPSPAGTPAECREALLQERTGPKGRFSPFSRRRRGATHEVLDWSACKAVRGVPRTPHANGDGDGARSGGDREPHRRRDPIDRRTSSAQGLPGRLPGYLHGPDRGRPRGRGVSTSAPNEGDA